MVCGFSLLLRCLHSGMHSVFIHVINKYLFNSYSATLFPASGKDTLIMQVVRLISYTTPFNKLKWSEVTQSCPTLCNPMEFSRQEYWSRLPFPSPGDRPDPGIKPGSLALQADSLPSEPPGIEPTSAPWQADSLPAEPQRKPSTA